MEKTSLHLEESYHLLLENVELLAAGIDGSGAVVYANPHLLKILGLSPENVIGLNWFDTFVSENSAGKIRNSLLEKVDGSLKAAATLEYGLKLPDGSQLPVKWRNTVMEDPSGGAPCVMLIGEDMSEYKKAFEKVRKSEESLRHSQKISHTGAWEWDIVTGKLTWSEEQFRIFGFGPFELEPTLDMAFNLIFKDDREKVQAAMDDAIAGTNPYNIEYRINREDGLSRHIHSRAIVYRDDKGVPVRMLGSVIDITDRKNIEEELRLTQQKISAIIKTVGEGVVVIDINSLITYVNQELLDIFGYEAGELTGKHIQALMPEKYRPMHAAGLKRYMEGGPPKILGQRLELEGLKKDGTVFPLEIRVEKTQINKWDMFFTAAIRDITSRKQSEQELRRHQESLALAQQIAHVGNWDWDLIENTLTWSDEIYRIFGLEPQAFEAKYESFLEAIHPGDVEYVKEALNKALYDHTPYAINHRILLPDREERIVQEQATVYFDDDDRPVRMIGTVQDITERKQAEKVLGEAHERLLTILDGLDAIVYVADIRDYELLFINKYARNLVEYTSGKTCWQALHSRKTSPCDFCTNPRLLKEDGSPGGVYIWEFFDPSINRWFLIHDRAIYWIDGRIVKLEIATDITERKKSEELLERRLRLEEALAAVSRLFLSTGGADFNKVLETIGEAVKADRAYIFMLRPGGERMDNTHEWTNVITKPNMTGLLGVETDKFRAFMSQLASGESVVMENVEKMPPAAAEIRAIMEEGGARSFIYVPIFSRENILLGFMGFEDTKQPRLWSKDDSRSMRIVSEMISNEIARKEAEKQAETHQQQLIHADKMKSLGVLVSGVAHEINNPNNFIMISSQTLTEVFESIQPILHDHYKTNPDNILGSLSYEDFQDMLPKLLSGISEGSDRIKRIVEKLKGFARKNVSGYSQEVDINQVTETAIQIVESLIKKSTTKFSVRYGKDVPRIKGNAQELEQVIINMITNACQSLPNDDCGISVSTRFDSNSRQVSVKVMDEGVGIRDEYLGKITEPFFTTKRDTGGTGLGLAISFNIIENHGGMIEYVSRHGKGTLATIKLPLPESAGDTGVF